MQRCDGQRSARVVARLGRETLSLRLAIDVGGPSGPPAHALFEPWEAVLLLHSVAYSASAAAYRHAIATALPVLLAYEWFEAIKLRFELYRDLEGGQRIDYRDLVIVVHVALTQRADFQADRRAQDEERIG